MPKTKNTKKRPRAQPSRRTSRRTHEASAHDEDRLAELAFAALRQVSNTHGIRIAEATAFWHFLSADRRQILIGAEQGPLVVLGAFAVTNASRIGRPQIFNLHGLKVSWRSPRAKARPTEDVIVARAAYHAYLMSSGSSHA